RHVRTRSLPVAARSSWAVAANLLASRPWIRTVAPCAASRSATARPSPSVDPVTRTTVSCADRNSGREGVELDQDVLAAGVPFERELDLAAHDAHVGFV